jgi:hypothetical protein
LAFEGMSTEMSICGITQEDAALVTDWWGGGYEAAESAEH